MTPQVSGDPSPAVHKRADLLALMTFRAKVSALLFQKGRAMTHQCIKDVCPMKESIFSIAFHHVAVDAVYISGAATPVGFFVSSVFFHEDRLMELEELLFKVGKSVFCPVVFWKELNIKVFCALCFIKIPSLSCSNFNLNQRRIQRQLNRLIFAGYSCCTSE